MHEVLDRDSSRVYLRLTMTNPMTSAAANLDASLDKLAALRAAGHEARNTKKWQTAMYNHSVYVLRGRQYGLCA